MHTKSLGGETMSVVLTLSHGAKNEYTIISNAFIDRYMPQANGSYVKVYLYLLRLTGESGSTLTLSLIADRLEETEKDIERALKYWEKQTLLKLIRDDKESITGIEFLPLVPETNSCESLSPEEAPPEKNTAENSDEGKASRRFEKPDYSNAQITALTSLDEVKKLISCLEQTLGRLLKPSDVQTLLFLYESVGFSAELITYLYEYCASRNKKSTSYIEAVGIAWAQAGVDNIEKAKAETAIYSQGYAIVNRAFGLNRAPGGIELKYIHRWFDTFGFDGEIIEEACNRTILSASKPDFKYTDKILANWHTAGIKSKADIAVLDSEFARKNAVTDKTRSEIPRIAPPVSNRFTAFPQRKYTASDYSAMEEMLLRKDCTHAD